MVNNDLMFVKKLSLELSRENVKVYDLSYADNVVSNFVRFLKRSFFPHSLIFTFYYSDVLIIL